jgi:hypothetical protein
MTEAAMAGVDTAAVVNKDEPARPPADGVVAEFGPEARAAGSQQTGDRGLLRQLTMRVLESALEGEITDHLGYDKGDPAGKNGGNSRNGARTKTVLTEVGPVEITVPRDRDGSFTLQVVKKRPAAAVRRGRHGDLPVRPRPDHRRDPSPRGRGVRRRHRAADHLHDHRQSDRGYSRVVQPTAGPRLSGGLPGRRAREDPRRQKSPTGPSTSPWR